MKSAFKINIKHHYKLFYTIMPAKSTIDVYKRQLQSYVPALHPLMKDYSVTKCLVCTCLLYTSAKQIMYR